jgi:phytoene desaturase
MKKALIIGSGIGSLSLAIRLLAKGIDVEIFEKAKAPGGHANKIVEDGYTFDTGPTLITAPDMIHKLFSLLGEKLEDHLELIALDPYYRIYFHDRSYFDYSGNISSMITQMERFNKRDADNFLRFLNHSRKIYNAVIRDGLGATAFNKISTMLRFVPKAMKLGAFMPAYYLTSLFFKDFRHRFMFSFHPLFIGGNPFRVPSVYLMISYLENIGGVWYAKGGMFNLIRSFVNIIEKHGGKIHLNSEVKEIIISENEAKGIVVNGEQIKADLVISNADVTHTYSDLIMNKAHKWHESKVEKLKQSMSAFILYLGVKNKYPQLKHHTLVLAKRYKGLIDDIFDNHTLPDDFSLYMHIPSRTDSSMAPENCESIYILSPVTNLNSKINWEEKKFEFADKIIDHLETKHGLNDLRKNIEVKKIITPMDFKNYKNCYLGSPWSLEPVLLQTALFRPHNADKQVRNLFLVGAGTHPGAGLPGVMLSAEATEKLIMESINRI